MSEQVIRAIERKEKPKKARRSGYAPGVVYGKEFASSILVKFEMNKIKKILKNHTNQIIAVEINDDIKDCIVKELQVDCITGEIVHVDLQTVDKDSYTKVKVPITFSGKETFEPKGLMLQVLIPEIEVKGKVGLIPKSVTVNVEGKELGDKITLEDVHINEELRILNEKDSILAVVIGKDQDRGQEQDQDSEDVAS